MERTHISLFLFFVILYLQSLFGNKQQIITNSNYIETKFPHSQWAALSHQEFQSKYLPSFLHFLCRHKYLVFCGPCSFYVLKHEASPLVSPCLSSQSTNTPADRPPRHRAERGGAERGVTTDAPSLHCMCESVLWRAEQPETQKRPQGHDTRFTPTSICRPEEQHGKAEKLSRK